MLRFYWLLATVLLASCFFAGYLQALPLCTGTFKACDTWGAGSPHYPGYCCSARPFVDSRWIPTSGPYRGRFRSN
jgi:hypothetical protein